MKVKLLFNQEGELSKVTLPKSFFVADIIAWDGIKHLIPYFESDLDQVHWQILKG